MKNALRGAGGRAAAALILVGLLAACGGGGDEKTKTTDRPSTTPTTAATTTTAPPVSPLTGLPAADLSTLGRPAIVVKIDNADGRGPSARPQIGLNQADIVYEEMVEGSVTRLAAIFHSTGSDPVGPVRSARTTDISVFSPLNRPLFAWSGANVDFAAAIRRSPLIDVGVDAAPAQYERRGDKKAPHNLYSATSKLWALAPADSAPPAPLFQYRGAGDVIPATAPPTGSVNIVFGGGPGSAPVDFAWDAARGGWARSQRGTPHVDEGGTQVAPQNVVIMFVDYVDTGYVDVSGAPVPEAKLEGSGTVWVLTEGKRIEGTWTKTAKDAPAALTDAAGAPIKLTPGRTWVELAPPGGTHITS